MHALRELKLKTDAKVEFQVMYTTSNLIAINLQESLSEQRTQEAIVYQQ